MDSVERRSAGRPTKEEAAAIAERVLEGARSAFCSQGIAGASMEEIAAATGVTKHTVYRRYPSKLALLDAVVEHDLAKFHRLLVEPGDGCCNPLDALEQVACRFFKYGIAPDNQCFVAFLTAESVFSPEMQDKLERWSEVAMAPLRDRVAAAQAAGYLRPGRPEDACDVLVDLIDGAARRMRSGTTHPLNCMTAATFFASRWRVFLKAFGVSEGETQRPADALARDAASAQA